MTDPWVEGPGGGRLWTHTTGTGEALLLVNGGPGMADYLEPLAQLLPPSLKAIRYEQRHCGRSSCEGDLSLDAFVADIDVLREHFGAARWILIGHSWGVDLALAYALRHPDRCKGIVGLAGGRVHNDRTWHAAYTARRDEEQPGPTAGAANMEVNRALNASWRSFCRRPTLLRELADLQTPVHFIMGRADIRPSWPTEQLAALLPNASIEILANADHYVWRQQPTVFGARLQAALRRFH